MLSHLFDRIDARPLGLARVIVGAAALLRALVAIPVLVRLADPQIMRAPLLEWMPAPSDTFAAVLVGVWVVAAILFAVGWKVPISGTSLFLAIAAVIALDEQTYSNHLYLMAWLVLLLTIAGSGATLNLRRHDGPVVRWPVLMIMAQLSIVYGFSALTKLNASFLSGEVLARTLGTGLLSFPEALKTPSFLRVIAALAVFAEVFISIFIWRPRFRSWAFLVGLSLHTSITLLMSDSLMLLVFSLELLALYPLFLDQQKLQLIWDDTCDYCRGWIGRFRRLDVLQVLDPVGSTSVPAAQAALEAENAMLLIHHERTSSGWDAAVRTLEHLVPTLWLAPALRLPGVRWVGDAWYRRQTSRRACTATHGAPEGISPNSKAR